MHMPHEGGGTHALDHCVGSLGSAALGEEAQNFPDNEFNGFSSAPDFDLEIQDPA